MLLIDSALSERPYIHRYVLLIWYHWGFYFNLYFMCPLCAQLTRTSGGMLSGQRDAPSGWRRSEERVCLAGGGTLLQ